MITAILAKARHNEYYRYRAAFLTTNGFSNGPDFVFLALPVETLLSFPQPNRRASRCPQFLLAGPK
jgi:hypothetical protein